MKRVLASVLFLGAAAAALLLTVDTWPFGTSSSDAGSRTAEAARVAGAAATRRAGADFARGPGFDSPEGTIRGRVHDSAGAGIGAAKVRVAPLDDPGASECAPGVTDDLGVFEISASGGAAFSIFVDAAGYAPKHEAPVRLGEDIDVELVPSPTLDGLVVDDQGAPVRGAAVVFTSLSGRHEIERAATSDSEGKWRLTGLPITQDTETWLAARAPGFAPYLTRQLWWATLEGNVRFTIVLRRGASIVARVVDAVSGAPVAGATVEIARLFPLQSDRFAAKRFGLVTSGAADAQGVARIGPISGSEYAEELVWVARAPGYAQGVEQLSAVCDGQELPLEIRLWKSGTLAGRVVDKKGQPVAGVRVAVRNWYETFGQVIVEPSGCLTGADGAFRLPASCSPDGARLLVKKETGQRGSAEVGPFKLVDGGTFDVPDVVLKLFPAAVVRVSDSDDRPLAGASIEPGTYSHELRQFFTGTDGRVLVSFDPFREGREVLVRVTARGFVDAEEGVVPSEESPPAAEIKLTRAAELRCRVTWADGSPAAGITVGLADGAIPVARIWPLRNEPHGRDDPVDECLALDKTDARGICRFGGIQAGPWHVAAWREERDAEPAVRIEAVTDATKEVVMRIDEPRPPARPSAETADVEIRVVDSVSGAPILDATVSVEGHPALPEAPGVFRTKAARGVARVWAFSRDYPKTWERRVDFSAPGSEKLQIPLDPGVLIKGRVRMPANVPITGARIACWWSDRANRGAPIQPNGDFEIRGVSAGAPLDFNVQIPFRSTGWNFVPMPFVPVLVPVGVRQMDVDFDLVPATQLSIWIQDFRRQGALDPWDVTITGLTPTWSREWRVNGVVFRAAVPSGQAVARCQVADAEARALNLDLTSDGCFKPIVIR